MLIQGKPITLQKLVVLTEGAIYTPIFIAYVSSTTAMIVTLYSSNLWRTVRTYGLIQHNWLVRQVYLFSLLSIFQKLLQLFVQKCWPILLGDLVRVCS